MKATTLGNMSFKEPLPFPNAAGRFIVLAYWPRGGWWKVSDVLQPTLASAEELMGRLYERGWRHGRILQIPETGGAST